jgi:hypothetical protein
MPDRRFRCIRKSSITRSRVVLRSDQRNHATPGAPQGFLAAPGVLPAGVTKCVALHAVHISVPGIYTPLVWPPRGRWSQLCAAHPPYSSRGSLRSILIIGLVKRCSCAV